jgi:hypothetical protein
MYAREVDEASWRLRELHREQRQDLALAALSLGLAAAATLARPALSVPLLVGGLALGALGVRALWRHWDLVDRLAGERDAYVIPEVRAYAAREAAMERRHGCAAFIRGGLTQPGLVPGWHGGAVTEELEALASELDDAELALDPPSAVACSRFVRDLAESPFLDPAPSPELLRWRVRQIRSGFRPRSSAA